MARRCNCVYVSMYCWQINNIWLTLNDGDTIADQLLFECTVRCYAKSTRLIKACNYWDNGTKDMSAIKSIVLHHHNKARCRCCCTTVAERRILTSITRTLLTSQRLRTMDAVTRRFLPDSRGGRRWRRRRRDVKRPQATKVVDSYSV